MTTFEPESLRANLLAKLGDRTTVLGAQLGSYIKESVPDIDLKGEYGGLKLFVERFLSPTITCVGKSGLDDLYSVVQDDVSQGDRLLPAENASNQLWQIFANPSQPGVLVVDINTGKLFLTTDSAFPEMADRTLRRVRRMTTDQQKKMARNWIAETDLSPKDVEELSDILDLDNHWRRFFGWFQNQPPPVRESWLSYRFNHIRHEFAAALDEVGVAPEHVSELCRLLQTSKKKVPKKGEGTKTTEISGGPPSLVQELSLRVLAQECVKRLTDEQLRDLQIPLGIVWDVLKHSGK